MAYLQYAKNSGTIVDQFGYPNKAKMDTFVKNECPIAYEAQPLFSGIRNVGSQINPNRGLIYTAGSKVIPSINYGDILLSTVLPSWKKYPNRRSSIVCSTSQNYEARKSHYYFHVYPEGNAICGVTPTLDINTGSTFKSCYYDGINGFLEKWMDIAGIPYGASVQNVRRLVDRLDNNWEQYRRIFVKNYLFFELRFFKRSAESSLADINTYDTFTQYMDVMLHPENNGFSLLKLSSLKDGMYHNREVWFTGGAYLLNNLQNLRPSA